MLDKINKLMRIDKKITINVQKCSDTLQKYFKLNTMMKN